ncbi:MAG: DNA helicase RecG, partial [Myxococcales bacterium]
MTASSPQQPLQGLLNALEYGARDRFARLGTLRGFEPLLEAAVARGRAAGLDHAVLERLRALGRGFDSQPDEVRRTALTSIARELAPLVALSPALRTLASAPSGPPSPAASAPAQLPLTSAPPSPKPPPRGPASGAAAAATPPATSAEASPANGKAPKAKTARKRAAPRRKRPEEGQGETAAEAPAVYAPRGPLTGPLATPLKELTPLRGRLAGAVKNRNFTRVGELLFYLPRAYEDRRTEVPIAQLKVGERGIAIGTIRHAGEVQMGRRRVFKVLLADKSGTIVATWFAYQQWIRNRYKVGERWAFSGEIRAFGGVRTVSHPEMEPAEELEGDDINFRRIVPIYPGFERTDQRAFRILCHKAVERYAGFVEDPLPPALLQRIGLPA